MGSEVVCISIQTVGCDAKGKERVGKKKTEKNSTIQNPIPHKEGTECPLPEVFCGDISEATKAEEIKTEMKTKQVRIYGKIICYAPGRDWGYGYIKSNDGRLFYFTKYGISSRTIDENTKIYPETLVAFINNGPFGGGLNNQLVARDIILVGDDGQEILFSPKATSQRISNTVFKK